MARPFPLSVVTPEKVSWEGNVDSLVIPAHEGQLGILPGHAPLLAQLTPGVVRIRQGEETRLLAVSGGYVEVFGGKVSLFAETAELESEIDAERARQAVSKARSDLRGGAGEPGGSEQTMAALRLALARLRVADRLRRPPPHSH
ncbi:MAG TPA: ATP synthase F1 subunit epsilon [Elusimicrobiota bacterium]|nr:ATP synthase F1 subunit epsilon [Elusimicrobiota bacterium]